jgi:RNA polymerase sigma-70 factor (ECF subfamily)
MGSDLLPRVARGDSAAVRECITRYGGLVWSLASRYGLKGTDAEDVVQEVFVDLWKSAERFDATIAPEAGFVAMLARRRIIDRRRQLARSGRVALVEDAGELDVSNMSWREAGSRASVLGLEEDAAQAERALNELSPDQQRVLRLSLHRGLSHESISRALGLPLGTVKTHARRGLIRLRELLGIGKGTLSEGGAA